MLHEPQSFLEHFFLFGDIPPNAYYGTYAIPLVILSYVIASLGSFTGLRLATDIHKAKTEKQKSKRDQPPKNGGLVDFLFSRLPPNAARSL